VGDPNPLVNSSGLATLRKAGIQVAVMDGEEREACYRLNAEFMQRMEVAAAS
jgi:pyrimidine deaminase RibD-like protein